MIPRIDLLIADSRIASLQRDYGDEYGIDQEFFVLAIRNAQRDLQTYMVRENREAFPQFEDIDLSAGVSIYDVPTDIFAAHMVYSIRYSSDGTEVNFDEDPLTWLHVRPVPGTGAPEAAYVCGDGKIYLDKAPTASGGMIRVLYERTLPSIDLRRARVSNYNSASAPYFITLALSTDGTYPYTDPDDDLFGAPPDYVSVVSNKGVCLVKSVPVLSYDSTTKRIYTDSGYTFPSGMASLNGGYVCIGYNASTHSGLDDLAETYFIEYCKHQVTLLLSSSDTPLVSQRVEDLKGEIAEIYATRAQSPMSIYQSRGEV